MSARIVLECDTGLVAVMNLSTDLSEVDRDGNLILRPMTVEEIATLAEREIARFEAAKELKVITRHDTAVPLDRTFRDAWTIASGAIGVDMPKARDIHRERIRIARAPMLAALDVEYQRADERGDAAGKSAIAAQKQALREATADPAIDDARTPEELKAVWPLPGA